MLSLVCAIPLGEGGDVIGLVHFDVVKGLPWENSKRGAA